MLTLDVAISTYQPEGIERVAKMLSPLLPQEGVKYIVSWQEHNDSYIPESLANRGDVEVYRLEKKGLSNNRNNAIDHCKGDIILIADDDLEYYPDFAEIIRKTFYTNSDLDLATFKIDFLKKKTYPKEDVALFLPFPKKFYVTSMEMAFRRESIKDLRFWPELGLGSPSMHCGEEEFFLIAAIKRALNCRFINETIAKHPSLTTGAGISPNILRGQGFIIGVLYPFTSLIRIPLKALRIYNGKNLNFFQILKFLSSGYLNSKTKWKDVPKKYKWQ